MQCTSYHNFLHKKIPYLHALQGNREMGARYLDPKYSRWISVDPALGEYVPGAGKANTKDAGGLPGMGGLFNTVNLNLFHYAGNNPIKFIDPDGRFERVVEKSTENVDYKFFSTLVDQLDKDKTFFGKTNDIQSKASLILSAVSLLVIPEGCVAAGILKFLATGDTLISIAYAAADHYSGKNFVENSLRAIKYLYDNEIPMNKVSVSITTERTAVVNKRMGAAFGLGSDIYYKDKSVVNINVEGFDKPIASIELNQQKLVYSAFVNTADIFLYENIQDYIPKINVKEDIRQ